MSRRTETWNAFETTLLTDLNIGAFSLTVETTAVLETPLYFVLDPDFPGATPVDLLEPAREWIKVIAWVGNTLTIDPNGRALEGSYATDPNGSRHQAGARLRAVFTKQLQDDIFNDIEDLESDVSDVLTQYVNTDGSNPMTQFLTLTGNAPTLDVHAANKKYVDDAEIAAIDHADNLDHNHAAPIETHNTAADAHGVKDNTDAPGNPHNHDRYTDQEAKDAVGFEDIYVKTAGGDTIAGDLTVEGLMKVGVLRARVNDMVMEALNGTDLLRWDDSVGEWQFKKTVDMENHILKSPLDPTAGSHVGDRNYNDVRYPVLAAGAMGTTTPYGCDIYSSATQSIPDITWTVLNMNTERYDPHSDFSLSTEKYTVPKTGLYVFGASVRMNADDIDELRVQVLHNTGASYEQETYPEGAHDPFISVFGIRHCSAGETLQPRVYQDSAGARSTRANTTRFWAGRLS